MKKIITLSLLFTCGLLTAQIVNIPDASFKSYLVNNTAINTNGNSEIELSEAMAFTGTINADNQNISNSTGIESFPNITGLNFFGSPIPSIDISANTLLETLNVSSTNLSSLDISNNPNLISISCSFNEISTIDLSNNLNLIEAAFTHSQFTTLDLSANPNLEFLWLSDNQFSSLDLSANPNLKSLDLRNNLLNNLDLSNNLLLEIINLDNNQFDNLDFSLHTNLFFFECNENPLLTSLNIANGTNSNITYFQATVNPNLTCIEVDDPTAVAGNANWSIDATASYSIDCASINVSTNELSITEVDVYPNPTKDVISIDIDDLLEVNIYNMSGLLVKTETTNEINLSHLPTGIYTFQIISKNGNSIQKVIKG